MKTTTKILIAPVLGAIATFAYAKPAHAAPEYVVILLDETGSMCTDSVPCMPTTGSFWLNALDDAKLWVNSDSMDTVNPPSKTQRFYSIWTFKNTQDGVQTNAVQLWPTAAFNTGCNNPARASIDGASGFCKFATGTNSLAYSDLQNVLESIKTMPSEIPQPTWLTPLADGICRGLSSVWNSVTNQNRTLILESDGGENDSILACMGQPSTTGNTSIITSQPDWGFTVGSWEANVYRRGARLNSFDSPVGGTFDAAEASAVAVGPLTSTDALPPGLTMKVSIQYALCVPGSTDPACPAPVTSMLMMQAQPSSLVAASTFGPRFDGDATADAHPAVAFAALAAPAALAATTTTTTTPVPSTDPNELAFFRTLGKATKTSKEREIVRDPKVVYGTTHRVAGDVDDSGCTDHADYSIVTQSDVWMQRAVLPLQIAIRADLNRDGWVNEQDRAIVLANWGKGCINSPGPKPVIPQ